MASDDRGLIDEAIAHWHGELAGLRDDDPGLRRLRAVRVHGDQRVCRVVRPHFVTPSQYEAERLATALVGSALGKVTETARREPALLDELGVEPAEAELIAIDPGYAVIDVTDRFDAFLGRRLGFVEIQGGAPGGIGYHDEVARAMQEMTPFGALAARYRLEPLLVVDALRTALLDAYREWGGGEDPLMAIVDWDDAPLMAEFVLLRDAFEAAGLRTIIADPRALEFAGGRLRHAGSAIDLVYRRVVVHDCVARPDDVRALVDAARAGAVCLVNPFANEVLGHKGIFDVLTTQPERFGLTAAEANAVHNHVPWTRRLVPDGAGGADTVPVSWALEHRTSVVLKPAHDYGGHGVHLGWELEPDEWAVVVERAVAEDALIQRRIPSHHERFPVDESGFPLRRFSLDTDPYVFRGRMEGMLTRLSVGDVTNITQGGSLVATFLLAPR